MSDLEKLARKIKAARKDYNDARQDLKTAQEVLVEAQKAVDESGKVLTALRSELLSVSDPGYTPYSL